MITKACTYIHVCRCPSLALCHVRCDVTQLTFTQHCTENGSTYLRRSLLCGLSGTFILRVIVNSVRPSKNSGTRNERPPTYRTGTIAASWSSLCLLKTTCTCRRTAASRATRIAIEW